MKQTKNNSRKDDKISLRLDKKTAAYIRRKAAREDRSITTVVQRMLARSIHNDSEETSQDHDILG